MALVAVTVYKFKVGAECYVPSEDDGFLVWQHDPQDCFEEIEHNPPTMGSMFDFASWWDSRCLKDNYAVMFGNVIADEFCGEPIDGVAWDISEVGVRDSIWNGEDPEDYAEEWRNKEVQTYIDIAEQRVAALIKRRKEEEPGFWKLTFHTAWSYWETKDSFSGECDGGCEYVGVMDITHKFEVVTESAKAK